ncbi:MAG: N-acetylmuramoyl-L-alanine amidase [Tissierellaceae bacterium]
MTNKIQKGLSSIDFINRGVKTVNFYVLRNTYASALNIELGFIDNALDNRLFDEKRGDSQLHCTGDYRQNLDTTVIPPVP